MRLPLTYCIAAVLLAAPAGIAQSALPGALPGGYTAKSTATTTNIDNSAGAAAAAFKEYGATSVEQKKYQRAGESIEAIVYTFGDQSGSYGAYSFLRTPSMAPAKFTELSCESPERALILTGNDLLVVDGRSLEGKAPQIKALTYAAEARAQQGVYPSLSLLMPQDHQVPRTDHYFLGPVALGKFWQGPSGDWVGFSRGAEAEVAKYRLQGRDSEMLLIDYPTPQIAAGQFQKITSDFKLAGTEQLENSSSGLYARRDGSMVALLSGAKTRDAAVSLLGQVHSDLVLTWDEPILRHPQPSMATVVVGTFIGTGEICGFTLLGGVLFSLIRLSVKRLWPGKIFDRPEDMEVIQLGLSTKPINSKDFY